MRFTVLKLACAAVCFTATAAEPITLTRFVMHFVDGQSALEYNERRRRDDHTVESKASIHVNFLADDTEYDFDLALLPSAFTRRATLRGGPRNGSFALASDFEPPSYGGTDPKNTKAVFTLGTNGFMAGTVFTANGTLSVTRGAGAGAHDLQGATHTWSEEVHEGCGMGVEKEEEHVSGGERRKREFDRWWGDGECYANDETTWALNTGIAVGYNMWVEMGESIAAVTEQIATIIQTTNVVVSLLFLLFLPTPHPILYVCSHSASGLIPACPANARISQAMDAPRGSCVPCKRAVSPVATDGCT